MFAARQSNSRLPTTNSTSPRVVVDLVSSDDEIPAPVPVQRTNSSTGQVTVIEIDQSSPVRKKARMSTDNSNPKIKEEYDAVGFGEANVGDEILEVSTTVREDQPLDQCDETADIEFIGGNQQVAAEMPHQREACPVFLFKKPYFFGMERMTTAEHVTENTKHCDYCYCYVCDCKVQYCVDWTSHCCATFKDNSWKVLKQKLQQTSPLLKLLPPELRVALQNDLNDRSSELCRLEKAISDIHLKTPLSEVTLIQYYIIFLHLIQKQESKNEKYLLFAMIWYPPSESLRVVLNEQIVKTQGTGCMPLVRQYISQLRNGHMEDAELIAVLATKIDQSASSEVFEYLLCLIDRQAVVDWIIKNKISGFVGLSDRLYSLWSKGLDCRTLYSMARQSKEFCDSISPPPRGQDVNGFTLLHLCCTMQEMSKERLCVFLSSLQNPFHSYSESVNNFTHSTNAVMDMTPLELMGSYSAFRKLNRLDQWQYWAKHFTALPVVEEVREEELKVLFKSCFMLGSRIVRYLWISGRTELAKRLYFSSAVSFQIIYLPPEIIADYSSFQPGESIESLCTSQFNVNQPCLSLSSAEELVRLFRGSSKESFPWLEPLLVCTFKSLTHHMLTTGGGSDPHVKDISRQLGCIDYYLEESNESLETLAKNKHLRLLCATLKSLPRDSGIGSREGSVEMLWKNFRLFECDGDKERCNDVSLEPDAPPVMPLLKRYLVANSPVSKLAADLTCRNYDEIRAALIDPLAADEILDLLHRLPMFEVSQSSALLDVINAAMDSSQRPTTDWLYGHTSSDRSMDPQSSVLHVIGLYSTPEIRQKVLVHCVPIFVINTARYLAKYEPGLHGAFMQQVREHYLELFGSNKGDKFDYCRYISLSLLLGEVDAAVTVILKHFSCLHSFKLSRAQLETVQQFAPLLQDNHGGEMPSKLLFELIAFSDVSNPVICDILSCVSFSCKSSSYSYSEVGFELTNPSVLKLSPVRYCDVMKSRMPTLPAELLRLYIPITDLSNEICGRFGVAMRDLPPNPSDETPFAELSVSEGVNRCYRVCFSLWLTTKLTMFQASLDSRYFDEGQIPLLILFSNLFAPVETQQFMSRLRWQDKYVFLSTKFATCLKLYFPSQSRQAIALKIVQFILWSMQMSYEMNGEAANTVIEALQAESAAVESVAGSVSYLPLFEFQRLGNVARTETAVVTCQLDEIVSPSLRSKVVDIIVSDFTVSVSAAIAIVQFNQLSNNSETSPNNWSVQETVNALLTEPDLAPYQRILLKPLLRKKSDSCMQTVLCSMDLNAVFHAIAAVVTRCVSRNEMGDLVTVVKSMTGALRCEFCAQQLREGDLFALNGIYVFLIRCCVVLVDVINRNPYNSFHSEVDLAYVSLVQAVDEISNHRAKLPPKEANFLTPLYTFIAQRYDVTAVDALVEAVVSSSYCQLSAATVVHIVEFLHRGQTDVHMTREQFLKIGTAVLSQSVKPRRSDEEFSKGCLELAKYEEHDAASIVCHVWQPLLEKGKGYFELFTVPILRLLMRQIEAENKKVQSEPMNPDLSIHPISYVKVASLWPLQEFVKEKGLANTSATIPSDALPFVTLCYLMSSELQRLVPLRSKELYKYLVTTPYLLDFLHIHLACSSFPTYGGSVHRLDEYIAIASSLQALALLPSAQPVYEKAMKMLADAVKTVSRYSVLQSFGEKCRQLATNSWTTNAQQDDFMAFLQFPFTVELLTTDIVWGESFSLVQVLCSVWKLYVTRPGFDVPFFISKLQAAMDRFAYHTSDVRMDKRVREIVEVYFRTFKEIFMLTAYLGSEEQRLQAWNVTRDKLCKTASRKKVVVAIIKGV